MSVLKSCLQFHNFHDLLFDNYKNNICLIDVLVVSNLFF